MENNKVKHIYFCEKCGCKIDIEKSVCENCGFLVNIKLKDQPKVSFIRIINSSDKISPKEWARILWYLLIPLVNIYIILKYGYLNKNNSALSFFLKGFSVFFIEALFIFIIIFFVPNLLGIFYSSLF